MISTNFPSYEIEFTERGGQRLTPHAREYFRFILDFVCTYYRKGGLDSRNLVAGKAHYAYKIVAVQGLISGNPHPPKFLLRKKTGSSPAVVIMTDEQVIAKACLYLKDKGKVAVRDAKKQAGEAKRSEIALMSARAHCMLKYASRVSGITNAAQADAHDMITPNKTKKEIGDDDKKPAAKEDLSPLQTKIRGRSIETDSDASRKRCRDQFGGESDDDDDDGGTGYNITGLGTSSQPVGRTTGSDVAVSQSSLHPLGLLASTAVGLLDSSNSACSHTEETQTKTAQECPTDVRCYCLRRSCDGC